MIVVLYRRIAFVFVLFSSFLFTALSFAKEYNVLSYGAKGDGATLNTLAIQKAIDACSNTGGAVVFPAGRYVTGTIYLKSNVTLRLQKGAVMLGSKAMEDYPENDPDYVFYRKGKINRALIYAYKQQNIALEGDGVIDGQGADILTASGKPVVSYAERPFLIWMVQCEDIRIEGLKLQNSAMWMQHYMACERIYIHDVEVYNHSNKNNDMIDINGCRDVIISDFRGDSDDDGITLKSTHAMPVENVTITNCVLSSHCNAIKCGTESNAGYKNITISNIVIKPSADKEPIYGKPAGISGISLEVVDGAAMDGVSISNVIIDGPEVPLFIRLGNRARGYDKSKPVPAVGSIENITISNVTAWARYPHGSSITGVPGHRVRNVTLENIRIFYPGGGTAEDAARNVPELEKKYPEATMFGNLSSYGMFVRHVENITMENIEFYLGADDARPPVVLQDVIHGKFINIRADGNAKAPFARAEDVREIFIQNPWPLTKAAAVIEVGGKGSGSVRLTEIDRQRFDELYTISGKAEKGIVQTGVIYE